MSVLQRKELEASPLADLHAIASELGLESYRRLRKAELVETILGAAGGDAADGGDERAAAGVAEEAVAVAADEDAEPDEVPAEEALERPSRRRRRGGRGRRGADRDETADDARGEADDGRGEADDARGEADEDEGASAESEVVVTGVLDILPNGSGFIRADGEQAYVSPAQIRRCELRPGDEVSGPVRPPRRNERHPSLIRVDEVNGAPAEPPEQRPRFDNLTPVFASVRLKAPAALDAVPIGRGSRVAVAGPPGAGATALLRELARELAGDPELEVQVVLAGVRPEEIADWREAAGEAPVVGGSFERSPDALSQEVELAVERAKRRVERGGHAAVVVDSLGGLTPATARRVFGAGRATAEGGSLTVIAAVGEAVEPLRWATSRVVLADGAVDAARSGTLGADRLS